MRAVGLIREALFSYICVSSGLVYGVATISRLLKIIGLFCRISSVVYGSFCKRDL